MSVHYYTLASDQDNSIAKYNLAVCYRKGDCVERNLEQAIYYFTLAANQGAKNSQFMVSKYFQILEVSQPNEFAPNMETKKARRPLNIRNVGLYAFVIEHAKPNIGKKEASNRNARNKS